MSSGTELPGLAGAELSAVVFVRDYVQLQFDGPVLTAITLPTVIRGSDVWGPHEAGYRDALCAQIGKTVRSTIATEGKAIELLFTDDSWIRISLDRADYRTAEAATYRELDGGMWVW
jgi:hypothetical protein